MNDRLRISVLESPRLRLRPLGPDDAEPITALLQDRTIAHWTNSIPWPYSIDDARAFLAIRAEADERGDSFVWGIEERSAGALTGTIGFHDVHFDRGRAELGYWIGEPFRNRGYTTEAARRVISWGFEIAGFERIQATYMPGNDASASVMRNIGMQPEGLLRRYGFKNGQHFDLSLQAVLKSDTTWLSTEQQWGKR